MKKSQICVVVGLILVSLPLLFGYDRKPLPQQAPDACPGWQESQGVFIGAAAYVGERTR